MQFLNLILKSHVIRLNLCTKLWIHFEQNTWLSKQIKFKLKNICL